MIKIGDRIEVVGVMADDPLPPPIGATGTVTDITPAAINADDGVHYKAHIRWDVRPRGREIVAVTTLLIPEDNLVWRKL